MAEQFSNNPWDVARYIEELTYPPETWTPVETLHAWYGNEQDTFWVIYRDKNIHSQDSPEVLGEVIAFPVTFQDYHALCLGNKLEKDLIPYWDFKSNNDRFVLWVYEIRVVRSRDEGRSYSEIPHKPNIHTGKLLFHFVKRIYKLLPSEGLQNRCKLAGCICTKSIKNFCTKYNFSFETVSPRIMGASADDDPHFTVSSIVELDLKLSEKFFGIIKILDRWNYEQPGSVKKPLKLFLSYERHNKEEANALYNLIKYHKDLSRRCEVFISTNIPGGEKWKQTLVREIWQADYILLLLGAKTLQSPWVCFEINASYLLSKDVITIDLGNNKNKIPKDGSPLSIIGDIQIIDWNLMQRPDSLLESISRVCDNPVKTNMQCPISHEGTCVLMDE